ncbi:hypothetical protein D3C77_411170 [compost metagenome]
MIPVGVRGMNVTAIDKYSFACPYDEIIRIHLEQCLSLQAVEELGFLVPMTVHNVLAWAELVPIGTEWQSIVAMSLALLQRAAHRLIHFAHLINFVL